MKTRKIFFIFSALCGIILSACSRGIVDGVYPSKAVLRLDLTPSSATLSSNTFQQFKATLVYADQSTQDVTSLANWEIGNSSVAVIHKVGEIRSLAAGTTLLKASVESISGEATISISPALLTSIQLTPSVTTVSVGVVKQFWAFGLYDDGSTADLTQTVTWASSDDNISSISNTLGARGKATGRTTGNVNITASYNGLTGTAPLTVNAASLVSIATTPVNHSVASGSQLQFQVTGTYTDNSTQDLTSLASWTSSQTAVATINSTGLATSIGTGTSSITATIGTLSASTNMIVTSAVLASITLTPTNPSVASGLSQQFTATGIYSDSSTQNLTDAVTWSSSNTSVATISNTAGSRGLGNALTPGTTTIQATYGTFSTQTSWTVTSANLISLNISGITSLPVGLGTQLSVTGTYSDSSTQDLTSAVTWNTSHPSIATVSNAIGNKGLLNTLSLGSTTVSATLFGVTGQTNISVTAAVLQSISVTATAISVAKGLSQQFTATGTYSDSSMVDITTSVTWSTSDATLASISNAGGSKGLLSSLNVGSLNVIATSGIITGQSPCTVTIPVLQSLTLTPYAASVIKSLTQQYVALGTYTDATTADLTSLVSWSTSNALASISNTAGSKGLLTAVNPGNVNVLATLSGVTGQAPLTVLPPTLLSITITPPAPNCSLTGLTLQLTATGNYSDGSSQNITSSVTWSATNSGILNFLTPLVPGLLTCLGLGTTTVTATLGSVSAQVTIHGIL